jgi:hypothetical protein
MAALSAYANACEATHPALALDLREKWGAAVPAPASHFRGATKMVHAAQPATGDHLSELLDLVLTPSQHGGTYFDTVIGLNVCCDCLATDTQDDDSIKHKDNCPVESDTARYYRIREIATTMKLAAPQAAQLSGNSGEVDADYADMYRWLRDMCAGKDGDVYDVSDSPATARLTFTFPDIEDNVGVSLDAAIRAAIRAAIAAMSKGDSDAAK